MRRRPSIPAHGHTLLLRVAAIAATLVASAIVAPAANAVTGLHTQSLSETLTPTDLATTLVGTGVTISNVQYTGANVAAGTFSGGGTGDGSIVGFDQGVVLSSGAVSNVVGPNTSDGITVENGQPGDADLNGLLPVEQSTQDAAVLTFDFVAEGASSVSFRYVFASDEYNEFVGTQYNDVFGFFVNGTTFGADCATVDGQPVSVNTINGGNPFGIGASRPELFRNNDPNDPGPATIDTEMDGLTTVLLCQAPVVPDATNTMKLAIADVNDQQFDSNVFIEAGSLTTTPSVGSPTDVTAYPSNGSAVVTWSAPDPNTTAPIDSFEVACTATDNPDDVVTTSVSGTETSADVGGLTNGTEYTCAVRASSAEVAGEWSDPSTPFTPSDAAVAQIVDPSAGGTVNLFPDQSFVGTSGRIILPAQSTLAARVASGDPVIVIASLFGTPGEIDATCGGNACVGQGIEWAISDPSAIGKMKVVFFESPQLVGTTKPKAVAVYKDGIPLPSCKHAGSATCVLDRDRVRGGGWKIVVRTTGEDPKGRI